MHFIEDATAVERTLIDRAAQARSPINGSIELTPICNMNCDMCYVRLSPEEMRRQGRLRTVDEWLEIARQMRDSGTLFLLLTGGEPLTYPDFERLYLELMKLGMLLTLNTNGTLIDETWADFFAVNKPRRINITLYGPDAQTYEKLCHYRDGFERTLRAIRLLRERDVPVRVSISVTPQNAPHIGRMMAIAHELDAAVLVDTYMMPAVRERSLPFDQQSRLSPEEAAQIRIQALKQEMTSGKFTQYVMESLWAAQHIQPDSGPNQMRCLAGSCSFTVNWQGQMRPCVVMSSPSASVLGMGFDAAWQHIRSEAGKITLSPKCSVCRLRLLCRTCAASALQETGRYDGTPEYMCRYSLHSLNLLIREAQGLARAEKGE
ncbi:MAG: radical SAM protein [Clostridia bacterium]|nr:radical SAM protein [Clostridia bacterium]